MALTNPLRQFKCVDAIVKGLTKNAPYEVVGPWGSGKTLVALQVAETMGLPLLIVTTSRAEAEAISEDLITFDVSSRCAQFPAWEVLPSDTMAPADDIVAERMNVLMRLQAAMQTGEPMRVVAPVRSLMQGVIARERLAKQAATLSVGTEYELDALVKRLIDIGYVREIMVEQRGQMSIRGGILDVFPISSELPIRVEFFGDEIESIRRFEPETQRSIGSIDEISILPRSEKTQLVAESTDRATLPSLLDYFPKDTLVVIDEPLAVFEEAKNLERQIGESPHVLSWDEMETRLRHCRRMHVSQVSASGLKDATKITAPMQVLTGWQGQNEEFWRQLQTWDAEGFSVLMLCANAGERKRLYELLEEHGYRIGHDPFDLRVELGRLRAGFASQSEKLAVLSERELFGRHYVRRSRRRFEAGAAITTFSDLKPGDYVVHSEHGIGRYFGLRRFSGKSGDFLAVQYSGGDKMYVPVTHIDLIQKYTATEGSAPKIDRLGGATWARTKERTKKALRDMTEDLLKLYAARESQQGHAFSTDTPWQVEFEDAFEYEETPDQARAIDDVKRNMESAKPMDRLVCGDVGYGKTEVAMRAAFKAVMDAKQVAVLVPTTVLAEQHYTTFSERFADFPVKVEMLSRFRSPKEIKQTIERLKSGECDVVIGTHRLVSKDIEFKNLGLVIIDEEQRFGVTHKERLKKLRTLVDVLTLSATPIPRTLNLSLMGVRDMSLINTAPNDRLPIHTCIENFDEELIREAIARELSRDGQVFYVHNRVQTILPVADLVTKLVPHAKVGVAHGQMHEHDLEKVMSAFFHKEVNVLVCTTIIGSGLDVPNANTIIVDRADHFGLAELYQLRGRVGRYKHRAFAYLLVPADRALSEEAQRRLKALEEFSTLGSGFRIAMRDMEIRGCGNILGAEQHGYIAAVGYDTYAQLVAEAVAEIKGEPIRRVTLPPFDAPVEAVIPDDYVPSEGQKITLYKRIAGLYAVEAVDEMHAELRDRFGAPPPPVERLLEVMRIRALAADAGLKRITSVKGEFIFDFEPRRTPANASRAAMNEAFGGRLSFYIRDGFAISYTPPVTDERGVLQAVRALVQALADA